jgi:hypothetical protein
MVGVYIREWVRHAVSAMLFMATVFLIWIRRQPDIRDKYEEIVVSKSSSDQTTMESIVSAQQAVIQLHSALQTTNITLLKLLSIALSKPMKVNKLCACKYFSCTYTYTSIYILKKSLRYFLFVLLGCAAHESGNFGIDRRGNNIANCAVQGDNYGHYCAYIYKEFAS